MENESHSGTSLLIPLLYWESSSSPGPAWSPHKYHFTSSCPSVSTARGQPQSHLSSKAKTPPPGKTLALTPAEEPVRISLNANLSGARSCSRALSESVWQSACMMTICYRNTLLFLRKKICGCFPLWRPPPKEGRCVTVPSPPLRQQHSQRVLSGSKTKELTASINYLTDNQHFFKLTLASPLFSR